MIKYPFKSFKPDNYGAGNTAGSYLLGSLYAWHGGLHLETSDDLVAIADGELVAYRVADKYTEEEIEGVGKTRYSNCFAILRHEHDADGLKLTYYSLYNHLWPASEMKNQFVSELFQKCTWVVDREEQPGTYGIWDYSTNKLVSGEQKVIVPYNCILEVHAEAKTKLLTPKIPYRQDSQCYMVKKHSDSTSPLFEHFLYVLKSDVETCGEDTVYEGIIKKTIPLVKPKSKSSLQSYDFQPNSNPVGIRHYDKAGNANSVEAIMDVIPKGTSIVISGKPVKGKWHKVLDNGKGKEGGFVLLTGKEKIVISSEFKPDEIVACNIPVKAGTVIGKAGDFGHEINGKYKDSCHFEIFTADNVSSFLENESDKLLDYLKLQSNATFTETFNTARLPMGYPLELIEKRGYYIRVKVPLIKESVPYSYLGRYSNKSKDYALKGETDESYEARKAASELIPTVLENMPQANLVELQKIFGSFLTADDRLIFKSKNGAERDVLFPHPLAGKEFWIRESLIEEPLALISPRTDVTVVAYDSAPVSPKLDIILSVKD